VVIVTNTPKLTKIHDILWLKLCAGNTFFFADPTLKFCAKTTNHKALKENKTLINNWTYQRKKNS